MAEVGFSSRDDDSTVSVALDLVGGFGLLSQQPQLDAYFFQYFNRNMIIFHF